MSYAMRLRHDLRRNGTVYLILLPAIVIVAVFAYAPMYGILIAFKNFKPVEGIWGSAWVGLDNFVRFFSSYKFTNVLVNTLSISFVSLLATFPAPILLAIMINQIRNERFKRVLQTVTYMPHFISTVVLAGMVIVFLNPNTGLYGHMMRALGVANPTNIMGKPELFSTVYAVSGIWQNAGWDSIIYLAALSAIDVSLYEAATVDGANEWKKIWHIDLPGMRSTMIILLILSVGGVMNVGFEKTFLLQNNLNIKASEVISTYVYKIGMINQQYSFSAAVGVFNTLINFALLLTVNKIAQRVGDASLW